MFSFAEYIYFYLAFILFILLLIVRSALFVNVHSGCPALNQRITGAKVINELSKAHFQLRSLISSDPHSG